jgi:hypothetical protein
MVSTGDFEGAALSGARTFDPAELVEDRRPLGLAREATYLWGTLRDDTGRPLSFMRRIVPEGLSSDEAGERALGDRLILQAAFDGADAMRVRREARAAASSDAVKRSVEDGRAVFRADGEQSSFALAAGTDAVTWTESGIVEVSGATVATGLQWYATGDDAMLYPTQTWLVDGEALGRPVRGFLFIEEAYMQPGGRLYIRRDPLHAARYLTWYSWATEWDDGTVEIGHHLFGQGRFHVGVRADSNGRVHHAREMDARITRNTDGYWMDRIDYTIDGEAWELVADPVGRMVDLGPIPNPQQEGLMQRVGETRQPVTWMAWGETVPANGDRRTQP